MIYSIYILKKVGMEIVSRLNYRKQQGVCLAQFSDPQFVSNIRSPYVHTNKGIRCTSYV